MKRHSFITDDLVERCAAAMWADAWQGSPPGTWKTLNPYTQGVYLRQAIVCLNTALETSPLKGHDSP